MGSRCSYWPMGIVASRLHKPRSESSNHRRGRVSSRAPSARGEMEPDTIRSTRGVRLTAAVAARALDP
jgi:hypothetical protein